MIVGTTGGANVASNVERTGDIDQGWVRGADGAAVPVLEGVARYDRALARDDAIPSSGPAFERHVLGAPRDALRLSDARATPRRRTGLDDAHRLAGCGAIAQAASILVLGGDGLLGELLAASHPTAWVTTLLEAGGDATPAQAQIYDHLRSGMRVARHRLALARPDWPLPPADSLADAIVRAGPLSACWSDGIAGMLAPGGAVLDPRSMDGACGSARPAAVELRVFAEAASNMELARGRLAAGRPLAPVDVEILYFGRRGLSLGEIAGCGERPAADVLAAADALAADGVAAFLPASAAAARLHYSLRSGEPMPPPDDFRPDLIWRRAVARFGARPAVVLHDGATLTFAGLDLLVAEMADRITRLGLKAGARIAILVDPCLEVQTLFWAAMALGLRYLIVPVGTTGAGLRALHDRLPIDALFLDDRVAPEDVDGTVAKRVVRFAATTTGAGITRRKPSGAAFHVSASPSPPIGALPCIEAPTSGTTGASKIVVVGAQAMSRIAWDRTHALGWDCHERTLSAQHSSDITEVRYGVMQPAVAGAAHVLGHPPGLGHLYRVWALLERHAVTRFRFSPALAGQIVQALASGRLRRPPSLTTTETGSTYFPRPLRLELTERLSVRSHEGYGTTEAQGAAGDVISPGEPPVPTPYDPIVQIRLEDGSIAADDELGVVWMLRDDYMDGYLTPDGLDRSVIQGFWYCPGDWARRTATGCLEIAGRGDDLFSIATGQLVVPTSIENVLQEHPAVAAAAVAPGVDDNGGTQIAAFVELTGQQSDAGLATALKRHVHDKLGPNFVPAAVHVVDRLPRNQRDKLQRRALAGRHIHDSPPKGAPFV